MNARALWPLLGLLCACGDIDPAPPVDDEGEVIPAPKPLDTWLGLRMVQDEAEGFALNPVLVVQADSYMDDDTLTSYAGAQLTSGGLGGGGTLRHVFTQRRLYWTPSRPLIDGLEYRATFALPELRSVTGSPPLPPATLTRLGVADGTRAAQALPPEIVETPGWDEIAPLLAARCGGCHGSAQWPLLTPMERDALVNTRDPRTDRPLVRPFDPADSYLLHKLLPDYPDRRGTQQPPPWSDDPAPLTPAQLLKIERWIAGGAPGRPDAPEL